MATAKAKTTARKKAPGKKRKSAKTDSRRIARFCVLGILGAFALLSLTGSWYAAHPLEWLENSSMPRFIASPLLYFGNRILMLTDALDWTGHDAVYETDDPAPEGQVLYGGMPKRIGAPAPADIRVLDRGDFVVGWSDSLRHPVWVAYHVPAEAKFEVGKRPSFRKDRAVPEAPASSAYDRSGYDRGHMAPNHAIATRFGPDSQAKTFLMSNIAPQSPALNRGPWRELERRIADLWTQRWGESWVICGAISGDNPRSRETLGGTHVDVPEKFWMLTVAQQDQDVRALALMLPQTVGYGDFPTHRIVTIDDLEEMTGFDLLPELPSYLQQALEADRPTRLWPIRACDLFKLIMLRFPGA